MRQQQRKLSDKEGQKEPKEDPRIVQTIIKAYKELLQEKAVPEPDAYGKLERLLSGYASLKRDYQELQSNSGEAAAVYHELAQQNEQLSEQLRMTQERERLAICELDKLKLKLAEAHRIFEQQSLEQQQQFSKLEEGVRNFQELEELRQLHERLHSDHQDMIRKHEEERRKWQIVKQTYEGMLERHKEEQASKNERNFTSSELENDSALKAEWGEFDEQPKQPPNQPEENIEDLHQFKSCPETHRELQERVIQTERALHDVGSKLTEASRIKEELERETSNLRRDHRNLLEELERAQIKSKELSSQLDKLGKELKTKSDQILVLKDKKHMYKLRVIEERAKREQLKVIYNEMLVVTEERLKSEYSSTPNRREFREDGTPGGTGSAEKSSSKSPEVNRSGFTVSQEVSLAVGNNSVNNTPSRVEGDRHRVRNLLDVSFSQVPKDNVIEISPESEVFREEQPQAKSLQPFKPLKDQVNISLPFESKLPRVQSIGVGTEPKEEQEKQCPNPTVEELQANAKELTFPELHDLYNSISQLYRTRKSIESEIQEEGECAPSNLQSETPLQGQPAIQVYEPQPEAPIAQSKEQAEVVTKLNQESQYDILEPISPEKMEQEDPIPTTEYDHRHCQTETDQNHMNCQTEVPNVLTEYDHVHCQTEAPIALIEHDHRHSQTEIPAAPTEQDNKHSQTDLMLPDLSESRIVYDKTPAKELMEEQKREQMMEPQPVPAPKVEVELHPSFRAEYEKVCYQLSSLLQEKNNLEFMLQRSNEKSIKFEATTLRLELELRDELERNAKLKQLVHMPFRSDPLPAVPSVNYEQERLQRRINELQNTNSTQEKKLRQSREMQQRIREQLKHQCLLVRKFRREDKACRNKFAEMKEEQQGIVRGFEEKWKEVEKKLEAFYVRTVEEAALQKRELQQRLSISEQSRRIMNDFNRAADIVELKTEHAQKVDGFKRRHSFDSRLIEMMEILLQGVIAKAHFANRSRSLEKLSAIRQTPDPQEKSALLSELLVDITTYTGELIRS